MWPYCLSILLVEIFPNGNNSLSSIALPPGVIRQSLKFPKIEFSLLDLSIHVAVMD